MRIFISTIFILISFVFPSHAGDDYKILSEQGGDGLSIYLGKFEDVSEERISIEPFHDSSKRKIISTFDDLFMVKLKRLLTAEGYTVTENSESMGGIKLNGKIAATTSYKCPPGITDLLTFGFSYVFNKLTGNKRRPACYYYCKMKVTLNFSVGNDVVSKEYFGQLRKTNVRLSEVLVALIQEVSSEIIKDLNNLQTTSDIAREEKSNEQRL